jgi:hypothetical protein
VSKHRRRSHGLRQPAAESANYGFYKFVFAFGVVASAVWFYAIFEWWGVLAAAFLCIPAGFGFTVVAPALIGTLRRTAFGNDFVMTSVLLGGGVAVAAVGMFRSAGPARALVLLLAAALVMAGITVIRLRSTSVRPARRRPTRSAAIHVRRPRRR